MLDNTLSVVAPNGICDDTVISRTMAAVADGLATKRICVASKTPIESITALPPAKQIPLCQVDLPSDITLDERDLCDLEMLVSGAFAPLDGYLSFEDFCSVVVDSKLKSIDALWPLPIVVRIPKSCLKATPGADVGDLGSDSSGLCRPNEENENTQNQPVVPRVDENRENQNRQVNLRDQVGTILAKLSVESCYEPNLDVVCMHVLGTTEVTHPHVCYLQANHRDTVYLGGKVETVHKIMHFDFTDLRKSPTEVRQLLSERSLSPVVGFQTRNPIHRSHFELSIRALDTVSTIYGKKAHLLLTPACGPTQPGDVKYSVRVRCYRKVLPYYKERGYDVTLVLLPLAMRMAGPREAVFHAIVRRNYGCSHFVVGRDHAGPSTRQRNGLPFYGPYEAHALLEGVRDKIGIDPVFGYNMVYAGPQFGYMADDEVTKHNNQESSTIVPQLISGTQFRKMLEQRLPIPEWYAFPPVVKELQAVYRPNWDRGFCLYFTGLPCAGKTTLANAVEAALLERKLERREVTILDADLVRTHLSYGLGYSRPDRQANVRRIGFVAATVIRHSGICLVANIAPYTEDREYNRQLVSQAGGGYIEVFVSTPQAVCEQRDVKGLYKKARLGVIKQFTSVSDPYEVPENPELIVDSSDNLVHKVHQILEYLEVNKWILPDTETEC